MKRIGALISMVLVVVAVGVGAAAEFAVAEEGAPQGPVAEGPVPVLGSKSFAAPYGAGFGKPEPEAIYNGGDPNGEVSKIHWTGWGNPVALGTGLNLIFRPSGGYYRKPVRIDLRATKLGKCGKQAAYTRLEVRVPRHPGGKLGRWRLWSGEKTICEPPH